MTGLILVPIDFSPSSRAALRWALDYAPRIGGRVEVLHVVHEPNPLYDLAGKSGVLETFEEAGRVATDAFVGEVCAEAQTPQAVERTVVIGTPASRIVEFARANGFVHVVMGARGHGSLGERLLGSKAERVCQLSEVPVTIVKA